MDVFIGAIGVAGGRVAQVFGEARFNGVGEQEQAVENGEPLARGEQGRAGAGYLNQRGEHDDAGDVIFRAQGGIEGEGAAERMA